MTVVLGPYILPQCFQIYFLLYLHAMVIKSRRMRRERLVARMVERRIVYRV